jgi:subfamily B ATP-binding cassette protein MsbA
MQRAKQNPWSIRSLLKPHSKALAVGIFAVICGGVANLLEPWPLKIVFDNVLKSRSVHGWLDHLIVSIFGESKLPF